MNKAVLSQQKKFKKEKNEKLVRLKEMLESGKITIKDNMNPFMLNASQLNQLHNSNRETRLKMITLCQQLDKGDDGQPIKELCLKLDELCQLSMQSNSIDNAIFTLQFCIDTNLKGKSLLDVINNHFHGRVMFFCNSILVGGTKVERALENYLMSTDERKAKIDQINKELEELL